MTFVISALNEKQHMSNTDDIRLSKVFSFFVWKAMCNLFLTVKMQQNSSATSIYLN